MARGPIDDILDALQEDRANIVYAGVLAPKDKSEFGFGYVSGYAVALEKIQSIVEAALDKEKHRE